MTARKIRTLLGFIAIATLVWLFTNFALNGGEPKDITPRIPALEPRSSTVAHIGVDAADTADITVTAYPSEKNRYARYIIDDVHRNGGLARAEDFGEMYTGFITAVWADNQPLGSNSNTRIKARVPEEYAKRLLELPTEVSNDHAQSLHALGKMATVTAQPANSGEISTIVLVISEGNGQTSTDEFSSMLMMLIRIMIVLAAVIIIPTTLMSKEWPHAETPCEPDRQNPPE